MKKDHKNNLIGRKEIKLKDLKHIVIGHEVIEGSVRPCDECGLYIPFDNPDADFRVCDLCVEKIMGGD